MALGYREHAAEFTEKNVVLFGIHDGSLDAARQWVEKEQLPFAVLNDPDRRVGIELGMSALDGERYVKDPSDGKRPAVVSVSWEPDEPHRQLICEWEPDMNHTDSDSHASLDAARQWVEREQLPFAGPERP